MQKNRIRVPVSYRVLLKFWKIMRLSVFFLVLFVAQTYATAIYSQQTRLTIKMQGAKVIDVLNKIEDESEFFFLFNQKLLNVERQVNVDVENENIGKILDQVFENTNVSYLVKDRQIILTTATSDTGVEQQRKTVSGKVTDASGSPLPGVTVVISGTTSGTITNAEGSFSLMNVPGNATLIFSFVGMKNQEVNVGGKSSVNIKMEEETVGLEEVIAIGYGSTTKRMTTAAISTINPTKLQNLPVASLGDGLAGRTNGVFVASSGGGPGKKPTISIRGGNTPLVVIDGIVATITDFQNLNPTDIENFSVLKDAEAAAVYGARAGNGIIAITTKRGESGKMNIQYDYSYNLAQPTVLPKKLGSYDRAVIINEARANDGQPAMYTDAVVQKYKDQSDPFNYPNTDWQKVCLKTFAPSSRHNLTLNGGNEKTKYFASISYYDQGTLFKFNTNWLKRYNYRFSMTNNFDKIGLTANVNIFGTLEKTRVPASQYGSPLGLTVSPYYFIWGHIQNSGPMGLAYNDLGLYSNMGDHPLVEMDPNSGYDFNESRNVNGILDLSWDVPWVKGLKIKAINHYRLNNNWEKAWNATANQYALGSTTPIAHNAPTLYANAANGYSYTNQFYGDYSRVFANDHKVSATFGYERTYGYDQNVYAQRINYQMLFDEFVAGPTLNSSNGGSSAESARAGFIGRLRYDYKTKYFMEGSFRRDGSDWFPKEKRWGTFWSGSAGWVLSEEEFMKTLNDNNILNYLKIRGSVGSVGLDGSDAGISRFQYMPGYTLSEKGYLINNSFVQGFSEGPLVSPDLTWYTQKSRNIGFDFATLNSKLTGSFDYFSMSTTGMLASLSGSLYTDPLGTSLPTVKSNGNFRRAGFEMSLSYKNNLGDFQYEIGGNLSRFDQLWKMNPNEDQSVLKNPYTRTTNQTGYWGTGYHCLGFYTSAEDVLKSPKLVTSTNLVPGDLKYEDTNGDGRIDVSDQRRIGKNAFPRVIYGFTLDLRYKEWFLSSLIQGSGNRDLYPGDVIRDGQVYAFQTDYWTPNNTNARYPRLMSSPSYNGSNNTVTSDFWLVNGRYIRLKSLQLGYDLKSRVLKRMPFISECTVILSGSNLFTVSEALRRFKMDPEAGVTASGSINYNNNYDYPTEKTYSLTLRVGF